MSATNRGSVRAPDDYYGTPPWITDAVLPELPLGGRILDAGAGEGQITRRLLDVGVEPRCITALELDPARARICLAMCPGVQVMTGDFLSPSLPLPKTDLVIMNPPYDVHDRPGCTAFAFVRRAHALVGRSGTVAALLRVSWLEGARIEEPERLAFLRAHPPDVYVSPRRAQFGLNKHGKLGSDNAAYAWMVWGPGRLGRIRWLDVAESPVRRRKDLRPVRKARADAALGAHPLEAGDGGVEGLAARGDRAP